MRSPAGTDALPGESSPLRTPIEERARSEKGEKEKKGGEGVLAPVPGALDPEYDRIGNLAIDLGNDLNWGPWVSNMGRIGFPAEWVEDVVRKMAGRGDMSMSLGHAILQRYQKQGGPDRPKGFNRAGENNGKTSVQQRPEETRAKIQRPDLPRTPEYASIHAMWDKLERGQAS